MKTKILLLFGISLITVCGYGQYTENKLPSGLMVADTASDADYTIIQYDGEALVKAIRMDSLRSYMTAGMAGAVESLDSVSGQTGQFIISDGAGWLAPASATYEGSNAYTFGYRGGITGYGSFLTGGASTYANNATGGWSFIAGGYGNTASGIPSFCTGLHNSASGVASIAMGYQDTASTSYAVALGYRSKASGAASFAVNGGTASGSYSAAFGNGSTASGKYSTALSSGTASGDYSFATGEATASGSYSFATGKATAFGSYSFAIGKAVAFGDYSFAIGQGIYSNSFSEISIGRYNDTVSAVSNTTWDGSDKLFSIGNGTGGTRSNALVMLKNGNTTATGDWTIDGDLTVTGMIDAATLPHNFLYFGDSTVTYTFASSDTWYHLTNASDGLWIQDELEQFTVSNDTITVGTTGDYNLDFHLSFEGDNGTSYAVRFYNVTQAEGIPTASVNTGRGAGNAISLTVIAYSELTAGDEIVLQIKADATNNATLKNSTIRMTYIHD